MSTMYTWREPTGRRIFAPTGKEPGLTARGEEAYWMLAEQIDEKLGPEGGTLAEIYHKVMGPLGLSLDNTRNLLKGAKVHGYIKEGGY